MDAQARRIEKLKGTLQAEQSKDRLENMRTYDPSKARFRSCALDTHDKLSPTVHRARPKVTYTQRQKHTRRFHVDPAAYYQKSLGPEEKMPDGILTELLALKMQGIKNSEWALLDTFEAHMCNEERAARLDERAYKQQATRAFLDGQMEEVVEKEREHQAALTKERHQVLRAVQRYRDDEAVKAAKLKQRNQKLKEDAFRQVADFKAAQAKKLRIKLEDEQAEVAECKRLEELDKQKAAAAKAAMQEEMNRVRIENEERMAVKRAALEKQRAEDKALMVETLRTLEKQEADRAQALKDFQEMIEARGNKAGAQVVKEANDRAEREERLMRELEERKRREEVEKVAREAKARAKIEKEVALSRAQQKQLKEAMKIRKQEELKQFVAEVKLKDRAAAEAERAHEKARRAAAEQNQRAVLQQMDEKLRRDYLDDIAMTERERKFMAPLLKQAEDVVKEPHMIEVAW